MLELDLLFRRGHFSLELSERLEERVIGLFGRSGVGKTTLLHLIGGLLKPSEGRIAIDQTVLYDSRAAINLAPHRRGVGIVFQEDRLFPHLSVEGNLRFARRFGRTSKHSFSVSDMVELLELGPLLRRRPKYLSGGERQRVMLARTLVSHPRLILMDEPLAALDQRLKGQILPFFRRVIKEAQVPVVYISHDLSELLRLTSSLLILDNGRALGRGSYTDLALEGPLLESAVPTGLLNVVPVEVVAHEPGLGCTRLQWAPEDGRLRSPDQVELRGPLIDYNVRQRLSVAIRPEDVAIATQSISGISFQNQLRGRIRRFSESGGTFIVEVDVGFPMLVEVSSGSFERLGLAAGQSVYCLLKANAISTLP